jgi:hypothetical protein
LFCGGGQHHQQRQRATGRVFSLSLSESLLCFFMDMDTGGGRKEPKSSLVPVNAQQLVKKSRKRK